jgi:radical SAM superfamily enzyme YgiQ (UPF0313 family)
MLLINPTFNTKYPQPPLGIASLAAVIEKNGFPVEILDANALQLSDNDVAERSDGEDVVGITAMTPNINSAIRIVKSIKQRNPKITIILGGSHATILSEEIMNKIPEIDIIVKGEGEETIVELYKGLIKGSNLKKIDGIIYRDHGLIENNSSRKHIKDLDSLPFLAYHLLPLDKYAFHPPHGQRYPIMAMLTSRGCPYNCIFCSKTIFGRDIRYQTPSRIVDEIEYLNTKFHVKEIAFYDDVFTLDKKRVLAFTKELKERKLDILWACESRVNLVTEQLLKEMKKSGCYMIAYGIESGNQMILDNLRKGITLDQIRSTVALTHKLGIQSIGYFMLGSPGDTSQTIRQTIDFAKSLPLDFVQFSIVIPYPGSDLYQLYLKSENKNIDWENFVYASLNSSNIPVFETNTLSKADLQRWNSTAYKEFYFRFSYILSRLGNLRSIRDIQTTINGFSMFLEMLDK